MSTKIKEDVIYGNIEIDSDEFSPQKVKIRITTMIDEDSLLKLKEIAASRNVKYQTLLNQIVKSFVSNAQMRKPKEKTLTEERVRRIVRQELKKKSRAS
jgi:predicted DNA binding CopG/RHH family protein